MEECGRVKGDLVELLFGDLDEERAVEVNMHLVSCELCRGEEKKLLRLRENLRKETPTPSPELRERIHRSLPARRRGRAFKILCAPIPAYTAIAASLIVALMVRGLPGESGGNSSRSLIAAGDLENVRFVSAGSFETSQTAFDCRVIAESSFVEIGLPPVDSL